MKIDLEMIENAFRILLSELEEKEIELPYDFYWSVPVGTRDNVYKEVENDIGSIVHDLERLAQCVEDEMAFSNEFRYLGNVLIAIADAMNK